MIPLVPTAAQAIAPSAGWTFADLLREVVASWIAHHQRLADMGLSPDL